jgi:hypothetical protein
MYQGWWDLMYLENFERATSKFCTTLISTCSMIKLSSYWSGLCWLIKLHDAFYNNITILAIVVADGLCSLNVYPKWVSSTSKL